MGSLTRKNTWVSICRAVLLLLAAGLPGYGQMKVNGRFLYDHLGNQIILRGVEQDFGGNKSGSYIDEIARTGANAVRICFNVNYPLTAGEIESMIQRAIAKKMVCFITPGWYKDDLQQPAYFLNRPDIKEVLMRYQNYIIIEVVGEPEWFGDAPRWAAECKESITIVRNAGYTCPLNMFPTGYGRDVATLEEKGAEVFNHDPLKNVIFQLQAYYDNHWSGAPSSTYFVTDAIRRCVATGLPIQIGVIAHAAGGGVVDYKTQMQEAHLNNMNYMVWAWHNPYEWNQFYNITTNGIFGNWTVQSHAYGDDFAYQMMMGHQYSINKTARPLPIFNGLPALRNPENPAGTVAGLDYSYYEGTGWTSVPTFSTLTAVKTGTVSTPDLSPRNREDNYAFRYTGYVQVPADGTYTFYTTSDDGSKLSIGNTQVVFNDGLHGPTEQAGTIGLKAGRHAITISFFEATGDQTLLVSYAGPGIAKTLIPASAYSRGGTSGGGGSGTGLRGEYYNNKTLTAPSVLVRTDAGVNLDNLPGAPAAGVSADNFSVRWTGQVEAPVSGSYTFSTVSDDGIRLWVNGVQVVNNWTDHAATTNTGTAITLTGGQKYNLTLEFYDALYGATARLQWAYPGQATQLVPATRLYPAAGGGGGGTTTYLSDLNWTSASSGFGTTQKDKSIDANPIRLNGVSYAKGIGTHGASSIVYNLGGSYSTFLSDIGLDDEVDPYNCGSVAFEVYLDNVLAYASGTMSGTTATKSINLNVSGKATLRLEVLLADGSNSCDHADWASARLLSGSTARLAAQPFMLERALSVYPNPSQGTSLQLRYRATESGTARVTLAAASGGPVVDQPYAVQAGENTLQVPTAGLKAGLYLLSVQQQGRRLTTKVVLKR